MTFHYFRLVALAAGSAVVGLVISALIVFVGA